MQPTFRNKLLSVLPKDCMAHLRPLLDRVELPVRATMVGEGEPNEHAYFLDSGLASIVASSRPEGAEIEVGHIGFEGMIGFHVLHDVDRSLNRSVMQVAGTGWRIAVPALIEATERDTAMRQLFLRFVHTYQTQLSQSALANSRYGIFERLARWLLMSHDRLDGDDLPLTHEYLSLMLGVRRSGVTDQIHVLEGSNLIRASRGLIRIVDRGGLEAIAGGCYGRAEDEYERLIGVALRR